MHVCCVRFYCNGKTSIYANSQHIFAVMPILASKPKKRERMRIADVWRVCVCELYCVWKCSIRSSTAIFQQNFSNRARTSQTAATAKYFYPNDRMNEQKYTRSYSVCRAENNNPKPKATEKEEEEKKKNLLFNSKHDHVLFLLAVKHCDDD